MKDALSVVRQFTSEDNLNRNGNLNTTTMKEMWDYENQEPFLEKPKMFLIQSQKNLKICNQSPKLSVNYVVEATKLNNVLMKESLVWEWIPLVLKQKIGFLMVRVKV